MARWLRFANTLGALELLAADVCAAAAARPHCLAPDDLARQFILLSRALHLFVDRARSPASLRRGPLPPTAARRAALARASLGLVRAAAAARPHLPGARCPDSGPSLPLRSAAAVSTNRRHCRRALRQCGGAHPLAPSWAFTRHPTVGATQLNDWVNSG